MISVAGQGPVDRLGHHDNFIADRNLDLLGQTVTDKKFAVAVVRKKFAFLDMVFEFGDLIFFADQCRSKARRGNVRSCHKRFAFGPPACG